MSTEISLIDSSVIVSALRGPGPVTAHFQGLIDSEQAGINEIVRMGLLVGCRTRREFAELEAQLSGLRMFEINSEVWNTTAELGFQLRNKGIAVHLPDLIIAATAIVNRVTLVHIDSDFEIIAQLSDLRTKAISTRSSS